MSVQRRRICKECGAKKSIRRFYPYSSADRSKRRPVCSDCHKAKVREWRELKPWAVRELWRRRQSRPEVKAARRAYLSRPDVRARIARAARENYRLRKHAGIDRVRA